jgi:NAD(P)-dependent dehydrogenase (short-subunit alcohol dehydrogenase family)
MMQRTWLITGVNSGFGRHLTEQLLARGDRVAGTVRKMDAMNDLHFAPSARRSCQDGQDHDRQRRPKPGAQADRARQRFLHDDPQDSNGASRGS